VSDHFFELSHDIGILNKGEIALLDLEGRSRSPRTGGDSPGSPIRLSRFHVKQQHGCANCL